MSCCLVQEWNVVLTADRLLFKSPVRRSRALSQYSVNSPSGSPNPAGTPQTNTHSVYDAANDDSVEELRVPETAREGPGGVNRAASPMGMALPAAGRESERCCVSDQSRTEADYVVVNSQPRRTTRRLRCRSCSRKRRPGHRDRHFPHLCAYLCHFATHEHCLGW